MSIHTDTRNRLKKISDLVAFDDLLNRSTLSDTDKTILRLHYLKEKDFRFIADTLGFAESTVKKRHLKALDKLMKLF